MRITKAHVAAFGALSHDRNPLHLDEEYSRATQFGRPVAHGVAVVLLGLGAWARGRRFVLRALAVDFKKPVFPGDDLDVQVTERGDEAVLRIAVSGVLRCKVTLSAALVDPPADPVDAAPSAEAFTPLPEARQAGCPDADGGAMRDRSSRYQIDRGRVAELLPLFGLAAGQLPRFQLEALLFASYLAGMEHPGAPALLAGIELRFDGDRPIPSALGFDRLDLDEDERFRQVSVAASGPGLPLLRVTAFRRPPPVRYALADVERALRGRGLAGSSRAGQVALVTGGARGLGSVLARAFALVGARPVLNVRRLNAAAEALRDELRTIHADALFLEGDAGRDEDCERMQRALAEAGLMLDVLVANAVPPGGMNALAETSMDDLLDYVRASVAMVAHPLHRLLPRVRPGGLVVVVSSVVTRDPAPRFAAYLTAKRAVEGLVRAFALERRGVGFVVARPPRMHTDLTNVVQQTDTPDSAAEVAALLLERIGGLPATHAAATDAFHEIDLDLDLDLDLPDPEDRAARHPTKET